MSLHFNHLSLLLFSTPSSIPSSSLKISDQFPHLSPCCIPVTESRFTTSCLSSLRELLLLVLHPPPHPSTRAAGGGGGTLLDCSFDYNYDDENPPSPSQSEGPPRMLRANDSFQLTFSRRRWDKGEEMRMMHWERIKEISDLKEDVLRHDVEN